MVFLDTDLCESPTTAYILIRLEFFMWSSDCLNRVTHEAG